MEKYYKHEDRKARARQLTAKNNFDARETGRGGHVATENKKRKEKEIEITKAREKVQRQYKKRNKRFKIHHTSGMFFIWEASLSMWLYHA